MAERFRFRSHYFHLFLVAIVGLFICLRATYPNQTVYLVFIIISGCSLAVSGIWRATKTRRKIKKLKEEIREVAAGDTIPEEVTVEDEEFLKSLSGLPTKFLYSELELATDGFTKELGRGGFGCVYEGKLQDGRRVAVKRLDGKGQGNKEFYAEVATISRIHHVNLVRLVGFCAQGAQRLLVYEFLEHGSLDRWLFRGEEEAQQDLKRLDWKTRYTIALETARALAYLHEECSEKILHLDVKPQNILLDKDFHAKVSDFGLSRSMNRNESYVVTAAKGTPGYLAPEWLVDLAATNKSDVFSYGMVLLELISGRRNVDHTSDSSNWYFPNIAIGKARENRMLEIVDPSLSISSSSSVDENQAGLGIRVALWCIQQHPVMRPAMSDVVKMLEGDVEVLEPPLSAMFSCVSVLPESGSKLYGTPNARSRSVFSDSQIFISSNHPISSSKEARIDMGHGAEIPDRASNCRIDR